MVNNDNMFLKRGFPEPEANLDILVGKGLQHALVLANSQSVSVQKLRAENQWVNRCITDYSSLSDQILLIERNFNFTRSTASRDERARLIFNWFWPCMNEATISILDKYYWPSRNGAQQKLFIAFCKELYLVRRQLRDQVGAPIKPVHIEIYSDKEIDIKLLQNEIDFKNLECNVKAPKLQNIIHDRFIKVDKTLFGLSNGFEDFAKWMARGSTKNDLSMDFKPYPHGWSIFREHTTYA